MPTLTKGINFATLHLKDALDLAILVEEEARDRYQELADQLTTHHTPAAAAFFSRMVRIEEIHRTTLAYRREKQFAKEPMTVTRAMIFDIEAPDYDEARAFMTTRQALDVAMHSELKAHAFFEAAAKQTSDKEAATLFGELRDEELEHQRLVKAEIDKLPKEPEGSAEPYSDEPNPL